MFVVAQVNTEVVGAVIAAVGRGLTVIIRVLVVAHIPAAGVKM
jgi:hypothetical protein